MVVNTLFTTLLVSSTAILTVALGVFGAYYAISGILAVMHPSRLSHAVAALIPHQSHAGGD